MTKPNNASQAPGEIKDYQLSRPPFLKNGQTYRQWKAQKRREIKAGVKAVEEYIRGSAYCPHDYALLEAALFNLREIQKSLAVKNWRKP